MDEKTKDVFYKYHPAVNFIFFALALGFTMMLKSPAAQLISFFCALIYSIKTEGREALGFSVKVCLPVILITAFINPAFNHQGVSILLYLPGGNPLTLESILYGFSSGLMLASVLLWFKNFNRVITSDKFIYLFGRIIPSLSLVLSMTLRFIPEFRQQTERVKEAQKSIGRNGEGGIINKIKHAVTVISIMVTWSLENAIDTADSMKSRGYGLKGRTAFTIYTLEARDKYALLWLIASGIYVLCGTVASGFYFKFFPMISSAPLNAITISFYFVYAGMLFTPVILNASEERKWTSLT